MTASVYYDDAWIGGSSVKLKCLSGSSDVGFYKLLNISFDCSAGLEVRLKVKQASDNKYRLVVNLQDGKQVIAAASLTPITDSSWTQLAFSVEPFSAQATSLLLEITLRNKVPILVM